ncbi:MAG: hypothetical protein KGD59_02210 [Candidatus Heimdallarchaeota archaeon]|nr:hypothetical protein [Candidatus Heimdallarchaeota archaeon]MBY8993335.1 hypothetical protein [Candidatus Heimdallarchaeota archaeon]
MSKNTVNYSNENFSSNRLPVGIDFSRVDVVQYEESGEEKKGNMKKESTAKLVCFNRVDRSIKPFRSKIQLGSYVSKENLKKILKKEHEDRSYFSMLEFMRKNDKTAIAIREDFDLLRDFFPMELMHEVEDFCYRILPKVEKFVIERGELKLTPRKRRGFILAIFKSFCRKNGRKFTKELLEEINKRFDYQRVIKLFEIAKAENDLINWNLLIKKPEKEVNDLRIFYLNVINNINRLKKDPIISGNNDHLVIVALTQKYIASFTSSKELKKALSKLIKHQDLDFASRLIIWSIAKHFAKEQFDLNFRNPESVPGWLTLFLIESTPNAEIEEPIPIRSLAYTFWSEFHLRNKLKESNLYPPEKSEK